MSKIDNFPYPTPIPAKIWGCSLWRRTVMLRSAESEKVRLIAVKLLSQNSILYDHDTSTSQTDGRTDGRLALAIPRSGRLRAVKMHSTYHHHHHHHHTTGLTWCRHSSASGPRYKVSVTDVVSVRRSGKTDTSSTQDGMMRRLTLT